jgi:hypothetical protein
MRLRRRLALSLAAPILLLSFCLAPREAGAYCLEKPSALKSPVYWSPATVTYKISSNLTDTSILTAIDKAFATWASVTCSKLAFTKGSSFSICTDASCTTPTPFKGTAAAISIFWFTADSDLFKPSSGTTRYFSNLYYGYNPSGTFSTASIAINAKDYTWKTSGHGTTDLDVQSQLMPLIGGVIGLCESTTSPSVMDGKLAYGVDTTKTSLSADDKNGLLALYTTGGSGCPSVPDGAGPTFDGGTSKDTASSTGHEASAGSDGGSSGDAAVIPKTESGVPMWDMSTTKKCTSSAQCASDEVCTAEGNCVKSSSGDSGCGCFLGGSAPAPLGLTVLLAAAVLLGRVVFRRRRS